MLGRWEFCLGKQLASGTWHSQVLVSLRLAPREESIQGVSLAVLRERKLCEPLDSGVEQR
jgi:hypothetical protein